MCDVRVCWKHHNLQAILMWLLTILSHLVFENLVEYYFSQYLPLLVDAIEKWLNKDY